MRLLRLEFENLNSLYGPHAIDFEADLQGSPLFLIAGPTGAGKSTLLDAISLALFGSTPRLSSRKGVDETQAWHALSRGTASGKAVLTFRKSGPQGTETYRATWEVWRGHKQNRRPDGNLQGPYRRLERLDEEKAILLADTFEEKKSTNLDTCMALVLEGLTIQDFNRCMLLAQGEFAAFLKATEADRSQILERLTQTEVFREIGARAAARASDARGDLEKAQQAVGDVVLLDAEEIQRLEDERSQAVQELQRLRASETALGTALNWLERRSTLHGDLTLAREELTNAVAALEGEKALLERLEAFETCREALGHFDAVLELRGRVTEFEEASSDLTRKAQEAEDRRASLAQTEEKLRNAFEQVKGRAEEEAPRIQEARRLRQTAQTAEDALARAHQAREAARAKYTEGEQSLQKAQGRRKDSDEKHRIAQHQLSQAPWSDLVARTGPWQERIKTLIREETALGTRTEELEKLRSRCGRLESALAEAEGRLGDHLNKEATLLSEAEACERELQMALEGSADVPAARNGIRTSQKEIQEECTALSKLLERLSALRDARQALQERIDERTKAKEGLSNSRSNLKALCEEETQKASEVERLRKLVADLSWSAGLALERSRLHPEQPCPLCGSIDHPVVGEPYQATRDVELKDRCSAAKDTLDGQEAVLKDLETRVATSKSTEAVAQEALRNAERLEDQAGKALGKCEESARAGAQALGWAELPEAKEVQARLDERGEAAARLSARLDRLERTELHHRTAQDALRAWEQEAEKLRGESNAADVAAQAARERHESEARRLSDATAAQANTRSQFGAELREAGLVPEGEGLSALRTACAEASRRTKAYEDAQTAVDKAGTDAAEALNQEGLKRNTLGGFVQSLEERKEERQAAQEAWDAAQAEAAAALGGQDPDGLEHSLRTAVGQAGKALEEARNLLQGQKEACLHLEKDLESLGARMGETKGDLVVHQEFLQTELNRLEIHSEEELELRRLPADEVKRLADLRKTLTSAKSRCEVQVETLQGQWDRHMDQQPADVSPETGIEGILVSLADAKTSIQAATETRIQREQRLAEHAKALEAQAEAAERLRAAQVEADLWNRMDKLLGTNKGEAFQKFAQLLNLRELLDKANARMQRLRPRFVLIPARDEKNGERLAFAVRDEAHAGEERPMSTLSGGETFLVSLAMALALADYRTVRMPIETLLIDEGFGTLDPRTLGEVMGALRSLTARGTQVGLISHVDSLKSAIPARILVDPTANGRSAVRTECDTVDTAGPKAIPNLLSDPV